MKNIKFSKYIGILLFITMLSLIVIASTYAKYTSNFTGTATTTAADWNVSIDGTASDDYDFVLSASSEKIYPGATNVLLGNIVVKNDSTIVDAEIKNINLTAADGVPDNITITPGTYSGTIEHGTSKTIPVYASWKYTDTDETNLANSEFSFTLNLDVDQVVSQ